MSGRAPYTRSEDVQRAILQALPNCTPLSLSQVERVLQGRYRRRSLQYALGLLVGKGMVVKHGSRRNATYVLAVNRTAYDPNGVINLYRRKFPAEEVP